jgi:glycogen debranching enzyme
MMPGISRSEFAKAALLFWCALIACSCQAADPSSLVWSTDSVGPRRFVSVHGRRAAIFGYSQDGLEIWAYPFQILTGLRVRFRSEGTTTSIEGVAALRRIVYTPEAIIRIYAGPDFIVREKLFVPLDDPGAIVSYEVESSRPVDIVVRFIPVLDLMWPAAVGGQEAIWNPASSAYLLSEASHRFTASIGSPDIVTHDDTPNRTVSNSSGLAFTLRAGGDHRATQFVIAASASLQETKRVSSRLLEQRAALEREAAAHYSELLNHSLQIETPDADINRALAWSEIALDQAWVCNPDLGCGLVAGYGPSRKARRPQYDWFFAGDGIVTIRALLAEGDYERAREELEFILKYQDQKTGMVWHELSQSASWLEWTKSPYMFAHVDISFDFLNTVKEYFSTTGDIEFVKTHWPSIEAAYAYCRSLLDPKDGLPRIPAGQRGHREQDELTDELTLSASWVTASRSFADLAEATGRDATEARSSSERAREAINQRYWDAQQNFWINGYTPSGTPLLDRNLGPAGALETPIFTAAQRDSLFDQLASSAFETDWGTRGRASTSANFAPNSYASGSVWATGTAGVASTLWAEHRPATAWPIWSALVPWSSLDSLGHMHEALAGDFYHEEEESVPEQTWSSATFLSAAITELFGLRVDAVSNRITFAPHLPTIWNHLTIRNVYAGQSVTTMHMTQSATELRLQMQNEGAPIAMSFDPEIPFGATLKSVHLGNHSIVARLGQHSQDTHAKVEFTLPHGDTLLMISYEGGVSILAATSTPMLGDPSRAMKITGVHLDGRTYTLNFDYIPAAGASFDIRTPWSIKSVDGARVESTLPRIYRLTVNAPTQNTAYQHGTVSLTFGK